MSSSRCIHVNASNSGDSDPASDWVPSSGHAKMLRDVRITRDGTAIGAVVLKHQKGMKESWSALSRSFLA